MNMNARIKYLLILVFILLTSCKNIKDDYDPFSNIYDNSKYNFLNLKRTEYCYKGKRIYTLNVPYPYLHEAFAKNNYILVDGDRINLLPVYNICLDKYKKNLYRINYNSLIVSNELNDCNISIWPLIDFSLKKTDTLLYCKDHWVILESKFYDNEIHDTIFKFKRHWRNNEIETIIYASKKFGFLGVCDTVLHISNGKLTNKIGRYCKNSLDNDYKIKEPDFDLELIKEFVKCPSSP